MRVLLLSSILAGSVAAVFAQTNAKPVAPPDAAQLVQQAAAALQEGDLAAAGTLLDQAKAADDKQVGLWAEYGVLANRRGDHAAAAEDLQKEIALHPANPNAYRLLAQLQLDEKKPDEATATLTAALGQFPKDEGLQLLLGRAQLLAGHTDAGSRTLATLARSTHNAGVMNDVAYELANNQLELPLAEQTARQAVELLEGFTQTWTLEENLNGLRSASRQIEATWDTLGWVEFQEKKLDGAENYVRAAWHGYQGLEVGRHLGEIALARGDKRGAMLDFQLAQAAASTGDESSPEAKQLAKAIETLKKTTPPASAQSVAAALAHLRSIPVGPGANAGPALYKMLINAQGVIFAEPAGTQSIAGAGDKLARAKVAEFLPKGSPTHLVLVGTVTCQGGQCTFALVP